MDIVSITTLRTKLGSGKDLGKDERMELMLLLDRERSKMETTSCEWCEIASACEYEVTFFRDDDRWATERSLMPKFCPNCGRKLNEDEM